MFVDETRGATDLVGRGVCDKCPGSQQCAQCVRIEMPRWPRPDATSAAKSTVGRARRAAMSNHRWSWPDRVVNDRGARQHVSTAAFYRHYGAPFSLRTSRFWRHQIYEPELSQRPRDQSCGSLPPSVSRPARLVASALRSHTLRIYTTKDTCHPRRSGRRLPYER
jgi:hypothetical protein